jgi:glutamate-1-semialdehyde 2,1-aminomutase
MSTDTGALATRADQVLTGGVNSAQRRLPDLDPFVITSTSGGTFTDASGREYMDLHMSYGATVLGYNDEDVDRAAFEASRELGQVGFGVTPQEVELGELIIDHVPSIERVLLTASGSEATYHALRLARAATGRHAIVKFQGSFHGWHDSVALNVVSSPERLRHHDPLSAGALPEVVAATRVVRFNDLEDVENALRDRQAAAVIVEPVAHAVGALLPEPGFLAGLRELCTRYGSVLIFDEIVTGFRHVVGGYQQLVDVQPDLTTLGKAIGNGYPIAVLGGRADLMEQLSANPSGTVLTIGTFNGHPMVAAAAAAVIRKLDEEPVMEHLYALGEQLRNGLTEVHRDAGVPAVVMGQGSVSVAYLLDGKVRSFDDLLRNDKELFVTVRRRLVEHAFFVLPMNLKRITLCYAHTAEQVDALINATADALRAERRPRGN